MPERNLVREQRKFVLYTVSDSPVPEAKGRDSALRLQGILGKIWLLANKQWNRPVFGELAELIRHQLDAIIFLGGQEAYYISIVYAFMLDVLKMERPIIIPVITTGDNNLAIPESLDQLFRGRVKPANNDLNTAINWLVETDPSALWIPTENRTSYCGLTIPDFSSEGFQKAIISLERLGLNIPDRCFKIE